MTAITVQVTADDIAKGLPGSCGRCPIALAVGRLLLDGFAAFVGTCSVSWFETADPDANLTGSVPLPEAARKFAQRFDLSDPVEPFSFEIDLPGELLAAVTP